MITKNYAKQTDAGRLTSEIVAESLPQYPATGFRFYGVNVSVVDGAYQTEVMFADDISQDEVAVVDGVVNVSVPIPLPQQVSPTDSEGKPYVRSEPRPLNCTTIFVGAGDSFAPPQVGNGDKLVWDAAISGEWTTDGAPTGFKQKTIDLMFLDEIFARGGFVHTVNAPHGSYLDMYVMCPPTGYYLVMGVMTQNLTGNYIPVDHNVVQLSLPMCNDAQFLDSMTASQGMPAYYKIRVIITTPTTDVTSQGSAMLMMYRQRTMVL